jgi:formylglycine-generating enzyme required for sulfatase activity
VKQFPEWRRSRIKPIFADGAYLKQWAGDTTIAGSISRSPVTNVSWFAARKYCACQGKRLARVDEWEYAAGASETKANGSDDVGFSKRLFTWYSKPNPKVLPPVGSGYINYYGIWDMHGLVWEWVEDFNSTLISGDSRADTEASSNLFCGSGALGANDFTNYSAYLRYGFRGSLKANYCINNLGFRCAMNIES